MQGDIVVIRVFVVRYSSYENSSIPYLIDEYLSKMTNPAVVILTQEGSFSGDSPLKDVSCLDMTDLFVVNAIDSKSEGLFTEYVN